MMTKNFFSKLTGIVVLLLLFIGCRQENLIEQNQNSTADTGKIISVKTINLSKPNPIADKANKLNITSKTSDTIFVDYNHVEYLDYGDRETYTFKILNSNPTAPLQNIVITEYPNGTSSSKTVTYNLTETEKSELLKGNGINFSQKISSIDNNINSVSGKYMVNGKCYEDQVVYISCGSGQHNSNNVNEWWKCVHPQKPSSVIIAHEVPCGDGGGDGTGSIGVPLPPSNTEPGDLDLTTPTIPAPNNFAFVRFISTLPTNLQNVINNDYNNDFYWGLSNYYYVNNGSQQAKNFITWAIQFKNSNSNVSFEQFSNWFIDGYSDSFRTNLLQLSNNELQEYISINQVMDSSPYDEEYVKETNEAFVAFTAYADIDTMTEAQMQTVLNNNCCAGLFFQQYLNEKVKTIKANYTLLRKLYPSWSKGKVFWHAARETIHLFLDIAGTVPVIGEVCDITNGVIYTIEGDGLNASLSYAGAIPIAGWGATGAKLAVKTVAGGISLAMIKNADGFYVVSRNQQLFRKVLGMVKGDVRIAHHIIPFALQIHPAVQKAMFSKNAFMINEALNGIPVSSAVHSGSHSNYNNLVKQRLDAIPSNYSPDQVYNEIIDLISDIKAAIQNHPNTPINQIVF